MLGFDEEASVKLVSGFVVQPYQAYAHPGEPTYAPKEVSIELLHADLGCYYRSDRFAVRKTRDSQYFSLPTPQLYIGGTITIRFHVRASSQTMVLHKRG